MAKIVAKPMRYKVFKDFLTYIDKLKKEKVEDRESALAMAEWVAKNVYDIDPETTEYTVGTLLDLMNKTRELSDQSEVEDLKN